MRPLFWDVEMWWLLTVHWPSNFQATRGHGSWVTCRASMCWRKWRRTWLRMCWSCTCRPSGGSLSSISPTKTLDRTCWDMELSSPYRSCPAERLDEAHGSKAQMPWLPIKSRQIWDGQMDLFSPSDPSARKSQAWGTDSWICLGHPHWVVVDSKKKWKSKMHLSKCLYMYVYIYDC